MTLYCFTASQTLNECPLCLRPSSTKQFESGIGAGDFNVENQAHCGRFRKVDETLLKAFVHENPRGTVRELAQIHLHSAREST